MITRRPSIYYLLSIVLFLHSGIGVSQGIEWEENYGGSSHERANASHETDDKGFIIGGYSESSDQDVSGNHGGKDMWIVKTDSLGNMEWEGNYGGSEDDELFSVRSTADGGVIGAGFSSSNDSDVTSNYGESDYWVIKLDSVGNLEWERNYGGSLEDKAYGVRQGPQGGYFVVGSSRSNDQDISDPIGGVDIDFDVWMVKIDSMGTIQWDSSYGGSSSDRGREMVKTEDGGFVIAGTSSSSDNHVSNNYGFEDCWLMKVDSNGVLEWENNYGGSWNERFVSVDQTENGGFIAGGFTKSYDHHLAGKNDSDNKWVGWIVRTDSIGTFEWGRIQEVDNDGAVRAVKEDHRGDFIAAGFGPDPNPSIDRDPQYWVIKLDGSGSEKWFFGYGGSTHDLGHTLLSTKDSGYFVAGKAASDDHDVSDNNYGYDFWAVKLCDLKRSDSIDTVQACYSYTVPSGDTTFTSEGRKEHILTAQSGCDSIHPIQLSLDTSWNSVVTDACFEYEVPSGDTTYSNSGIYADTLTNSKGCDSILKIDLTINSVDTFVIKNSSTELEAYFPGASYQWLDCDNGYSKIVGDTGKQFTATSNGSYALEITKNGCTDTSNCHQITGVGIAENQLESKVSVHPNPTTDKVVTVEIPEREEKLHVVLRDASGEKIRERDIEDPSRFKLDLGREDGLYIVELRGDDGKNSVIRVVKE